MGNKITIDSATMMNKVFEIIEAKNIFNFKYNQLSILTHPKSYIHAIIKFENGLIKIIAHDTDMKIPIINSVYSNQYNLNIKSNNIDIKRLNEVSFSKVNLKKFPLIKILNSMPRKNSLFETILVSANDEFVSQFLSNKISFLDINKKILQIIRNRKFNKYKRITPKNINDIIKLHEYVRLKLNQTYKHLMIKKIKLLKLILFFVIFFNTYSFSQIINNIIINGNERIPNETILMFSTAKINENIDSNRMNEILKNLYDSNFFKDVSVKIDNEILYINVDENPIIQEIIYKGIKSNRIKEAIKENLILKPRSSYNEISLKNDKENVKSALKKLGYYFSEIEIYVENLQDNKVNITFDIDIGDKAKIKKISFIGNKIFKERKLKSLIVSEEYKFWKFISGKKYLNEDLISLDKRLLKNYYLNKGFFNVEINSSFARLVDNENFELIYNINANKKFFFDNLSIKLPNDFDQQNFDRLKKLFSDLKGEPYSLNRVKNILEEIDLIALEDQYLSVNASVEEKIVSDKINLTFTIDVSQQSIVEKLIYLEIM